MCTPSKSHNCDHNHVHNYTRSCSHDTVGDASCDIKKPQEPSAEDVVLEEFKHAAASFASNQTWCSLSETL